MNQRMKKMFKKIIKKQDENNKNIIKYFIDKETVKLLNYYFHDLIKHREFNNNTVMNNMFSSHQYSNYGNYLEDRSSEASTSTSTSTVSSSSVSENSYHQVHPVRTTDEKDPSLWHISSEDQPSYSHYITTTNNMYNEKKQFYPSFIYNMDNFYYLHKIFFCLKMHYLYFYMLQFDNILYFLNQIHNNRSFFQILEA